jgi:hypothetical protein
LLRIQTRNRETNSRRDEVPRKNGFNLSRQDSTLRPRKLNHSFGLDTRITAGTLKAVGCTSAELFSADRQPACDQSNRLSGVVHGQSTPSSFDVAHVPRHDQTSVVGPEQHCDRAGLLICFFHKQEVGPESPLAYAITKS